MSRGYFAGWYFKHQLGKEAIAFIPGISRDQDGQSHAFIQVVTPQQAWNVCYPAESFTAGPGSLWIRVGESFFTRRGVAVDICDEQLTCKGKIAYGCLTPLPYDIMGPFALLPFMECRHGVQSLEHSLRGCITLNGRHIALQGGKGYMESDRGHSFPKRYFWAQCNDFANEPCSLMLSAAEIPYAGLHFPGCICAVYYRGKHYRLASYTGARVENWTATGLTLRQGSSFFSAEVLSHKPQQLAAPRRGSMNRAVGESLCSSLRFTLVWQGRQVFSLTSDKASFEEASPEFEFVF